MENQVSRDSLVVVTDKQVSSDFLDDETVVLDVREGAYYVLNPVGARIWALIQEPKRVHEIVDALMEEYDVEKDQCSREVVDLLTDLVGHELVEIRDESS